MNGFLYKIISKKDGKFYFGSSINVNKRFKRHRYDLKHNKHHSSYLQKVYNKYGLKNLEYIIVRKYDNISEIDLHKIEERYINMWWNTKNLLNISKKASGGDLITYHPNKINIRKKQSINSKWSEERKNAHSLQIMGINNPNYGNKWNEKQKEKQSNKLKIFYQTNTHILKGKTFEEIYDKDKVKELKENLSKIASNRIGEKNGFYGKTHNETTIKKNE